MLKSGSGNGKFNGVLSRLSVQQRVYKTGAERVSSAYPVNDVKIIFS